MFKKCASKITDRLLENRIINEAEYEIYCFGFKTGFVILSNVVIVLLIGFILGMPIESLLFLLAFISLRSCAGGIHTSNNTRCMVLSAIAVFLLLLTAYMIQGFVTVLTILLLAISSAIVIYVLSPVQDKNKPLDDTEVKLYRRRTRKVLCLELCLLMILLYVGFNMAATVLALTVFIICISVCLGALKNTKKQMG